MIVLLYIVLALLGLIVLLVWAGRLKWAALVDDKELLAMGLLILLRRHNDYGHPFKWIPRWFTAFLGPQPKKLFGSAPEGSHYDIPPAGTCVVTWPLFFSIKLQNGICWRLGFRPDYADYGQGPDRVGYYNLDTIWPKRLGGG